MWGSDRSVGLEGAGSTSRIKEKDGIIISDCPIRTFVWTLTNLGNNAVLLTLGEFLVFGQTGAKDSVCVFVRQQHSEYPVVNAVKDGPRD